MKFLIILLLVLFYFLPSGPAQVVLHGVSLAGNIKFNPLKPRIRDQSDLELKVWYGGKSNTNTQWKFKTDDGTALNTNCWAYGLDFTGVSWTFSNKQISLLTARHGITCDHSPPNAGDQVVYRGSNGILYTNGVFLVSTGQSDLCVITLSNDVPAYVHPFLVMPTNFLAWFPEGMGNDVAVTNVSVPSLEAIWYRPNTDHVNVTQIYDYTSPFITAGNFGSWISPTVFSEGMATPGDSGSPLFLLLNGNQLVFVFATFGAQPLGPFVSDPAMMAYIQSITGVNYPLKFVDLVRYRR